MTNLPSADTPSGHIDYALMKHPFTLERIDGQYPAGETLDDIMAGLQPDPVLRRHAHVYIDADYIPQENWHRVRPRAGTRLTVRLVPTGGGGGKNPLRTVLSIALMAAAPMVGASLATALGVSAQTTFFGINAMRVITAGVGLASRLALNALAPPARSRFTPQGKESPTLFIQGARNQAQPFGRVPKVLGRHRFVPPLGAYPYTETVGDTQYLRMLFVWGYGPLHISDLRIGETPLHEFSDIDIETRYGYDDDPPLTLYTGSVLQNDMSVNLRHADDYILRTTAAEADEISVDITLPRGLFHFNQTGGRDTATIAIEIQYAPTGTDDWSAGATTFMPVAAQSCSLAAMPPACHDHDGAHDATRIDRIVIDRARGTARIISGSLHYAGIDDGTPQPPPVPETAHPLALVTCRTGAAPVIGDERRTDMPFSHSSDFAVTLDTDNATVHIAAGGLKHDGLKLSARQSTALRRSVVFAVPKGQYDVRLRRLTPDSTSDNLFNETVWTALRTLRYETPVRMKGLAMTAIRIKATDQMNGVIDRFNGVVHSIIEDWDGDNWTPQPTANPAALFRHVLQGRGNARPLADHRLDLSRLQAFHAFCQAQGAGFNAVVDYDTSVHEILHDIAAAGRASPTIRDGKWSVIQDQASSVPVQHFTPHNTAQFQGRKAFDELPDGLRVRFINSKKGWVQDECVVYHSGVTPETAQKFDTLDLTGITDPAQAYRTGRYHLATARLRPETYSFTCDIEHIVCTRGDMIRFTHDVPMFGIVSGRITAVLTADGYITGFGLSDGINMTAGTAYGIRIRSAGGESVVYHLHTTAGLHHTVMLATPVAAGDPAPAAGDLFMCGEEGRESVEMIVKSIEPQARFRARLTCVDAARAIHQTDDLPVPAFNNNMTLTDDMKRPPAPVLAEIQSGSESLIRATDGSLTTRIVVSLQPPVFTRHLTIHAEIRNTEETAFHPADVFAQSANRISIAGVEEEETYDIRLRYMTAAGLYSPPLTISGHKVMGTAAIPTNVENMRVNILGDTAYISWDKVYDLDLSHYTLRWTSRADMPRWNSAVDLVSRISKDTTAVTVPAMSGAYLLKAVDLGGRISETPAIAISNVSGLAGYNAVIDIHESAAGFTGTHDGTESVDNNLQLSARTGIDLWEDFDVMENTDKGPDGLRDSGLYQFAERIDLGAAYTSRVTADMLVDGLDLVNTIDLWENVDLVDNIDQMLSPTLYAAILQIRTTADEPNVTAGWSDWVDFVAGDHYARAFDFRIRLEAYTRDVTPVITALRVHIDMPDRTASVHGVACPATGMTVSYARPFRTTPALAVTAQNMASGDYYTVEHEAADGFYIRFFDKDDVAVARSFDYLAQGYGALV